ncbi:AraC family transcriptional regulator [Acinetobacter sp. MD2(2019)]|uniref:AraC family transcriptional regulator n=1 Tax=Acinetobacter sp. MD2(2019) TaxID=2605273 RepID=UPI002D1E5212|nr:AraC family transcriptional regulator [Acinetobacter sp. MD2(2019)]MEB3754998.1 helix-turn-helix transcriptional regulator [Acinetobacter sp. MD2(2019)]
MHYQILQQLQQHKTQLLNHSELGQGMQLAAWSNQHDLVQVCSDHHTLSLYVQGGYESYQKTASGWRNGGGPDHFCLMPQAQASTWDIRGELSFVHLYYTDQHLKQIASRTWDKEPNLIQLDEKVFAKDPYITLLYRQFLMRYAWQENQYALILSSTAIQLLMHLLKNYSTLDWALPQVTGGLSPYTLRHVKEWIEQHLQQPLTIADLAEQAHLSEYHFAHMFRHSTHMTPHQYVMQRRLDRAFVYLGSHLHFNLTQIASLCGFSSASHFSRCFKQYYGYVPSLLRAPPTSAFFG